VEMEEGEIKKRRKLMVVCGENAFNQSLPQI
jgi:hypothetical protein